MSEEDDKKAALFDKRLEVGVQLAELHVQVLKINRELLKAGASVDEIGSLNDKAFCW